jgi:diadenosine tetraphosphate (Ap4A) HIT family hydrolase
VLDHDPDCKACRANAQAVETHLVWRNNLWVLRHTKPPYAALGWMTLHSQRHAPAFTQLSPDELADLGPTIALISQAIIDTTGALRVYLASMTEVTPHFHAHLVPRYAGGPEGWEAYKLKEQAKVSPPDVSDVAVAEVIEGVAARMVGRASLGR